MANLLQSSQTQATTAPGYYTDYLSNLASAGQNAATGAQYVGAQPLQEQAFQDVSGAASAFKPTLEQAGSTLGQAANANSPLSAAAPYLTEASGDVGQAASGLMSPYIRDVVNSIGELGQRNIMQNLAPQATAGAVGSGQFGSKRGAEVLGQTIQNAQRDILNQQNQALNTGWNTALQTALGQKQLEGTLGSTAGNLASAGQQNLTQAGLGQAKLAETNQNLNLADINALATLGEQQRTLKQNQSLFPLSNLSTLSSILRGYNVPTSTTTTMNMSPLSAMAGVGAGALGLFTPGVGGKTPFDNMKAAWDKMFPGQGNPYTNTPTTDQSQDESSATSGYWDSNGNWVTGNPVTADQSQDESSGSSGYWDEDGNWVQYAMGGSVETQSESPIAKWDTSFAPHMNLGGLPVGAMPQYDQSNTFIGYNDTDGNFVRT